MYSENEGEGVKGRLEFFRKFIRFGGAIRPLQSSQSKPMSPLWRRLEMEQITGVCWRAWWRWVLTTWRIWKTANNFFSGLGDVVVVWVEWWWCLSDGEEIDDPLKHAIPHEQDWDNFDGEERGERNDKAFSRTWWPSPSWPSWPAWPGWPAGPPWPPPPDVWGLGNPSKQISTAHLVRIYILQSPMSSQLSSCLDYNFDHPKH